MGVGGLGTVFPDGDCVATWDVVHGEDDAHDLVDDVVVYVTLL